ncbi:MAG: type B DNA-directed DNA polymerase [Candidatus Nanohalobium sp.]
MTYKVDFINGKTITWRMENGEKIPEKDLEYMPHFYISGTRRDLRELRPWLHDLPGVTASRFENWKTSLSSKQEERVLRVDTLQGKVMETVNRTKKKFPRSRYRFYNVDLTPQFRYCLQEKIDPTQEELEKLKLGLHRKQLAQKNLAGLRVDGEKFTREGEALEALARKLSRDPGILQVNRGQLLPLLEEKLAENGFKASLGKMDEVQQLAGGNTVSSYGKTVHSNARYNVPGRVVIDESNSFLLSEATMEGLWDLVHRSYKPMQELAWGSIGNLLTAIEIRKAYHRENTLTPWKNWEPEKPKKASTMHKADRGGFIFSPEPGVYEDVCEVDFASLYPNIMITRKISPETVACSCCDNSEVPGLDFSICKEQEGFISEVLRPLVNDRASYKEKVKEARGQRRRDLQGSIDAIKWLLVSCFGYMGHAHASYGAIKCHQAINAYDRKIMLQAKEKLEKSGYEIKHGIVDSLWVSEREDAEDIHRICKEISEEVGIDLEFEHDFEWVAFLPRSNSQAKVGTLNRYFGKKRNGGFKTAGIETEQSSKPEFIQDAQMQMIKAFDPEKSVEDVIEVLEQNISELEEGEVEAKELVVEKTASKTVEAYKVENRTVAALKRNRKHGIEVRPGQKVRYVVRDDEKSSLERVRLDFEASTYDTEFYVTELVRACESILSPLGLDRRDIRDRIEGRQSSLVDA